MKKLAYLLPVPFLLAGCGGALGANTGGSATPGAYSGTVDQGQMGSSILELTVAQDGSITGKATLVSKTSALIVGKATLSGVSSSVGSFTLSGTYAFFLPPPPNTTWNGPLTVSGAIPPGGAGSAPVQLVNGGTTFTGTISSN